MAVVLLLYSYMQLILNYFNRLECVNIFLTISVYQMLFSNPVTYFLFRLQTASTNHLQEKTTRLNSFGRKVGLRIRRKKTEVMTLNIASPAPIKVGSQDLHNTATFT